MKILVASECLRFGGAQIFALRLAKSLSKRDEVYVYYNFRDYLNKEIVDQEYPDVKLLAPEIPLWLDFIIRKLDRILYYLKVDFSLRDRLVVSHISKTLKDGFDLVHSHMFKSNYLFAIAMEKSSIPLIITTHGCYETFYHNYMTGEGEVLLNYTSKLKRTIRRVDAMAVLTNKNREVIDLICPDDITNIKVKKIYNGFIQKVIDKNFSGRESIGIKHGDFVFGMVARGIKEKGWEEAIKAFIALNTENIHLVLVGDSTFIQTLKRIHSSRKIHFIGYAANPVDWINTFDAGLLPSYFKAESLPNSLVECLSCDVPVIATDVGEIREMLTTKKGPCGFTIGLNDEGKADTSELEDAMKAYLRNDKILRSHSELAGESYKRFDMTECYDRYMKLYKWGIEKRKNDIVANS